MVITRHTLQWLLILTIILVTLLFILPLILSESLSTYNQVLVNFKFSLASFGSSKAMTFGSTAAYPDISLDKLNLTVHYVRYYNTSIPNKETDSLTLLDCLAVYSVILNLKPSLIYVHTNAPSIWPFGYCGTDLNVTIHWPPVKLLFAPYEFVTNGKRIAWISHEADIRKLKVVEEYGGLTLDFDVYIINGIETRRLFAENACVIFHEELTDSTENIDDAVNIGFFGCREPHSSFPQLVLRESYEKNYDPACWLCNIEIIPMQILRNYTGTAELVDNVCNTPNWLERNHFNQDRDVFSWKEKPAYHSWFHNSTFTLKDVMELDSDLGDVFRWILKGSPPNLIGEPNR